jgi:hypothetical protein
MINSINITFGNRNQFRTLCITQDGQNDYQFRDTNLALASVSPEVFDQIHLLTTLMGKDTTVDHRGRLCTHLPQRAYGNFDRLLTSAIA